MKVEILSESSADEAAIRVLAEAALGVEIEPVARRARPGGFAAVLRVLPVAVRDLHFRRRADGLIVVLDSNDRPVYGQFADGKPQPHPESRLVQVRTLLQSVLRSLTPLPGHDPVKVAVGMAVPAVEAWYLCGEPNVSENAWAQGQGHSAPPYTKTQLKKRVYGTDIPGLPLETQKAVEAANRLAQDLSQIERVFPVGFGSLVDALRTW